MNVSFQRVGDIKLLKNSNINSNINVNKFVNKFLFNNNIKINNNENITKLKKNDNDNIILKNSNKIKYINFNNDKNNKIKLINENFKKSENKNKINFEKENNNNNNFKKNKKENNKNEIKKIILNKNNIVLNSNLVYTKINKNFNKNNDDNITINKIEKIYYIEKVNGDGNCLFYSLSNLIFGNSNYHHKIRQLICNYMENNIETKEFFEDENVKKFYLDRMRKDREFGTGTEIQIFSIICGIKIIHYTRYINNYKCLKTKNDKIIKLEINENGIGNFGLLLDSYINLENINHYSPLIYKKGNSISDENLMKIKKIICGNSNSKEEIDLRKIEDKKIISCKKDKIKKIHNIKNEWKFNQIDGSQN